MQVENSKSSSLHNNGYPKPFDETVPLDRNRNNLLSVGGHQFEKDKSTEKNQSTNIGDPSFYKTSMRKNYSGKGSVMEE